MTNKGLTGVFSRWVTIPRTAGISAGIVLGYTGLTIVIARSYSEKDYDIVTWGKENYGDGITRNSPEFQQILKPILSRYLKGYKKISIWCMIQSKGVENRFLVLPDMAAKNLPKAVFWSFKKEVELGNQDVVFDFDVTGERKIGDKKELEVMACSAPSRELQDIKSVFKRAGWPLTGITITSFAFQNLFKTGFAGQGSKNIGTLFIGADWSRIDIFSEGHLIMSRDIKTGTRSMTEVIEEHLKKEESDGISIEAYLDQAEPLSSETESPSENPKADETTLPVNANHFFDMIHMGDKARLDEVFELIHPVVDRLIRQIERTIEHFSMTCKGEVVERLYFTGPLCGFNPLLTYTGKQLGIPVSIIDPFKKESGQSDKTVEEIIEQDEYVPSAGLALSDRRRTLNFIYTYKDKNRKRWNHKVSQILLGLIVITALAGLTVHLGFSAGKTSLKKDIQALSQEIKVREALYGKVGIIEFSNQIKQVKERASDLAAVHRGAAAMSELSLLTPYDIKLLSCEYQQRDRAQPSGTVLLKGIVASQERRRLDDWINRISASPLVATATLTHVRTVFVGMKPEQYFESTLELK